MLENQATQQVEPNPQPPVWGTNDRSVINEEPIEDEESNATQESLVCQGTAEAQRRIVVELNTEEFSPLQPIRELRQENSEEEEWNNC